ncbi:hypothetical protein CGLO_04360 [Colletotrichum gloeosporioides Cg-14]|uniref:Uncharacterized protein n=1 Tax=Colletotrichum gloeosporioides (strain Cg-14) TaxID=1237896 RepID=T0KJP1_COLGC|nr:hypothetical protein CGLO_04360 [Colletotrichum gloeosporioides Cg-14]
MLHFHFDFCIRPPTTCTVPSRVQLHLVASGIFTDIPCVCKPTARIDAALENGNNVAVASPVCQASSFSNLVNGACGSASPVPTTDNAAVRLVTYEYNIHFSSHCSPTVSSTRHPVDLSPVLRASCHASSQNGNPIKDPGRLKFEVFAHQEHHPSRLPGFETERGKAAARLEHKARRGKMVMQGLGRFVNLAGRPVLRRPTCSCRP